MTSSQAIRSGGASRRRSCERLEPRTLLSATAFGPVIKINSTTEGIQASPSVGMDASGNFFVTWLSKDALGIPSIQCQRFDRDGAAIGAEMVVGTPTAPDEWLGPPEIAVNGVGDAVIVWETSRVVFEDFVEHGYSSIRSATVLANGHISNVGDSAVGQTFRLVGQQFADGNMVDGGTVAVGFDDQFVIGWTDHQQGTWNPSVVHVLSATGEFVSSPIGYETLVDVALSSIGEIAVASFDQLTGGSVRLLDDHLSERVVLPVTGQLVMDVDGNLVVNWKSLQRYDANGAPIGAALSAFPLAMEPDGDFFVAEATSTTLALERFDSFGNSRGPASATYSFAPGASDGAVDHDGNAVVVWEGSGPGDSAGVFAQLFRATPLPPRVRSVSFMSHHDSVPEYRVPVGNGNQLRTIPLASVDGFVIRFDHAMTLSTANFAVFGDRTGSHEISEVVFDPLSHAAYVRTSQPLLADNYVVSVLDTARSASGLALDGEWTNPAGIEASTSSQFPTGNGNQGGDFEFRVTILPGDANRDNRVTSADYTVWADNYGAPNASFEQGDFNGDGGLTPADYTIWADNFGIDLTGAASIEPAAVPIGGAFQSSSRDTESAEADASITLNAALPPRRFELEGASVAMRRVAEQPVSRRRSLWREDQLAAANDEALLAICAESEPSSERHDSPWSCSASIPVAQACR